ncbi:chromosome partition protein Smc [Embleya hyalina]|uniref:Chromosome partition protein Smc n=2 Tax=Embleya hyalina TaxID=516124 RepID=A0A401YGJ2_9ACTN|nr:chromosome partition protein Smc [Embleya hyalina]
MRGWLREPGPGRAPLSGADLRGRLVPEHFADRKVPSRNAVYTLLKGQGLTWEFVEAVVDVCSDDHTTGRRRLDEARVWWDRLHAEPAAPGPARDTTEVVHLQRRVIAAQDEIALLHRALGESERARDRMTQVARFLRIVVHQATLRMADLTRERDALLTRDGDGGPELARLQRRLHETEAGRAEARAQRERAERDRDAAQDIADRLAHQLATLRLEVERLRRRGEAPARPEHDPAPEGDTSPVEWRPDPVDDFVEDARAVLDRTRALIEDGENTLRATREHLHDPAGEESDPTVVAGEVVDEMLSGTTPNNPATSPGTDIVRSADHHGPAIPDLRTDPRRFAAYLKHLRRTGRDAVADRVIVVVAEPVSELEAPVGEYVLRVLGKSRPADAAVLGLLAEAAGGTPPPAALLRRAARKATDRELPNLLGASERPPRRAAKTEILRAIARRPPARVPPYSRLTSTFLVALLVAGGALRTVPDDASGGGDAGLILLGVTAFLAGWACLSIMLVGLVRVAVLRVARLPTWVGACRTLHDAGRADDVRAILRAMPKRRHADVRRALAGGPLAPYRHLVAPRAPRGLGPPRLWLGPQPPYGEEGSFRLLAPTLVLVPVLFAARSADWIVALVFAAGTASLTFLLLAARPRPDRTWWYGFARQNPARQNPARRNPARQNPAGHDPTRLRQPARTPDPDTGPAGTPPQPP